MNNTGANWEITVLALAALVVTTAVWRSYKNGQPK